MLVNALRGALWRAAVPALALLLLASALVGCSVGPQNTVVTIGAVFPLTGADAAVGAAMERGVALAVQQNAKIAKDYTLTLAPIDSAVTDGAAAASALSGNASVMGVVGPFDSASALTLLPSLAANGIASISPSAGLPALTLPDQAQAEGVTFTQIHPSGKPVAFFRLAPLDSTVGKAAADLALASTAAHGLAAHSVFIVDDGTASGKAQAAAVKQELAATHGELAGQKSLVATTPESAQLAVSAIIKAVPDAVIYCGGVAGGADMRRTLTLSGAPQMPILAASALANDPTWASLVGVTPAAGHTTGILPAADLTTLKDAKTFSDAYTAAFPGKDLLPQSALAYDAAMDEIAAIQSLLHAGKTVTRAAVLASVTSAKYAGVTGTLAFDAKGDLATTPPLSIYTCDTSGVWHYQASISG